MGPEVSSTVVAISLAVVLSRTPSSIVFSSAFSAGEIIVSQILKNTYFWLDINWSKSERLLLAQTLILHSLSSLLIDMLIFTVVYGLIQDYTVPKNTADDGIE